MARGHTTLLDALGTSAGSGLTTNTIPKATGAFTLGDSSITDNGSVVTISEQTGIGGTPTTGLLDVFGTGTISANLRGTGATGSYTQIYDSTNSAVRGYLGYGAVIGLSGITDFGLMSFGPLQLGTNNGTVALTIDTSQRVRIGATTTNFNFSVLGSGLNMSGTGYNISGIYQDETNLRGIGIGYDSASQTGIISAATASAASNISFWTYSGASWGERLRIASNGQTLHADGTAAAPSGAYITDPTTGSFFNSTGFNITTSTGLVASFDKFNTVITNSTGLLKSATTLTDFSGASIGTLTNAPTATNPTKWIAINDNGVRRLIPAW